MDMILGIVPAREFENIRRLHRGALGKSLICGHEDVLRAKLNPAIGSRFEDEITILLEGYCWKRRADGLWRVR